MTKKPDDRYVDPETYLAEAPRKEGSWWPEWAAWLGDQSGANRAASDGSGCCRVCPLCDAPGTYVLQA